MRHITRQEWIAALRSGKYSQTQEYFKDSNGFCCLGVACDLAQVDESEYLNALDYQFENVNAGQLYTDLGLMSCQAEELAIMNDRGDDFDEIADYIEREMSFYTVDEFGCLPKEPQPATFEPNIYEG